MQLIANDEKREGKCMKMNVNVSAGIIYWYCFGATKVLNAIM